MKQQCQLKYGNRHFPYILVKNRRRHMAIYVLPDATVEVRVPSRCSHYMAEAFLLSELDFVVARQSELMEHGLPPVASYEAGSSHYFLGDTYELEFTGKGRSGASLSGNRLLLEGPVPSGEEEARQRLLRWYRRQSGPVFSGRLEPCMERLPKLPVSLDVLMVKPWKMKSKWGTCRPGGKIHLNQELVKYPLELIDYVLCHELAHLFEFNHSARFYRLLEQAMPDWKEREQELEKMARKIV